MYIRDSVCQVNVVEAFDQSLCNMSRRLQRLTLSSNLNVRSRNIYRVGRESKLLLVFQRIVLNCVPVINLMFSDLSVKHVLPQDDIIFKTITKYLLINFSAGQILRV